MASQTLTPATLHQNNPNSILKSNPTPQPCRKALSFNPTYSLVLVHAGGQFSVTHATSTSPPPPSLRPIPAPCLCSASLETAGQFLHKLPIDLYCRSVPSYARHVIHSDKISVGCPSRNIARFTRRRRIKRHKRDMW